ncbi:MAG: SWIM zinc finger family protein, partial [Lysobacter sp.]|nr:SWIM zinc finger family protein [Lysobacter sp.]
ALGNRGLLRRAYKDLETHAAEIETAAEGTADIVQVRVAGHTVRFDARGPAQAQCGCPAAGVCQHILAAAIALQRSADAAVDPRAAFADASAHAPVDQDAQSIDRIAEETGEKANQKLSDKTHENVAEATNAIASNAAAANDDAPLAPLHAALLAFDAAALRKHAGKAGYRWAWQYVQDLDPERGVIIDGEKHVRIAFAHPRIGFRYMGGGLDALIADAQPSQIEKYRVAAVLAYRRAYGATIEAPEPAGRARTDALDLGMDHALPEGGEAVREDARARLRERTKRLLLECVELGLSHLSPAIEQRFSTLAVWAQGAEYYRLALALRRLADHVEWLNERAGGADEHRLCDEIAFVYGLISALDAAAARGAAPAHLLGRARNRYEATARLELLGLGAHAWRSASGYVGLTMLFWSPSEQAFYSCTDARPEQQRGFDPIARYRAAGPWAGLGAPQQATGRRIVLDGAQLSAQGRISGSEATTATVQALAPDASFVAQLPVCARWSEPTQARADGKRSLLSEPQPMRDWAVLRPARFGEPQFDAARQTLVWPIYDDANERLDLELPYAAYTEHAIGRIEAAAKAGVPPGTCVVARLRDDGQAVAEPLSLIEPETPSPRSHERSPERSPVDALYFDAAPAAQGALAGTFEKAWKRLRQIGAQREAPAASATMATEVPAPLRELRHVLLAQAERGIGPTVGVGVMQTLDARLRRLRDAGFHGFPPTLAADVSLPEHLLRLHYLQLQYARLYDGGAEPLEG